jgi:oligoendopeptidase F
VYQYSTGIASAVAIVDRVREEGEPAAADYREALRMGGSEYPVEVLRQAGVDVTRSEYLETALHTYGDLLDEAGSMVHD